MENYLKNFDTHSDYETFAQSSDFIRPNVSICIAEKDVHYNPKDYSKKYLTFRALEDGTFSFSTNDIQYSLNNGNTWSTLTADNNTPTVTKGNKILWKASGLTANIANGIGTFSSTGKFIAEGNVMSLHFGDNFEGQVSLNGKDYAFLALFRNCTNLISIGRLCLPATTLSSFCYTHMFRGCTSLTTTLQLPATTLANNCYQSMFFGCTNLLIAPILPATTLTDGCYTSMFYECRNLINTPQLPSQSLAVGCYSGMFSNCVSLIKAPELPANTLFERCYSSMFSGCTSLITAPILPATTLANQCYASMFSGCTSLTTAPELSVTTLAEKCYYQMFYGCTSLTTAPVLPATTLVNNCYASMFNGCSNLNYIKAMYLAADNAEAIANTSSWVNGVASTGTFVMNDAATWYYRGNDAIPEGWTIERASN